MIFRRYSTCLMKILELGIMQENLMILSECEEINSLLYKPIVATQRIKYTCINVSVNYIVLGSTSGSLYLFIREPCTFQQLIPLLEGPVSCVVISPDEKTIALATKRGTVCLIAVKPTIKLLAVSNEHLGETVTNLCWNDNSSEIYIGDGIGKISTMVLSIFTVNGMFQAPSCALMHLDSAIVQIQFSGHFLLVSTMSRSYICDTSQEQFKQIGNKARYGEFGACFLKNNYFDVETRSKTPTKEDKKRFRDGTLNTILETNIGETRDDSETKIYSARPGCRLWEVTTSGTVVKTHQFKEALGIPPCSVYRLDTLKFSKNHEIEENWLSQQASANFFHLHVLCGKYLFSHTRASIYVIDPTNAAVILWTNEYSNITMARTINDRIYLMTDSGKFHCLRLTTAENLIIKLYEDQNYSESLRACQLLKPEYLKSKNMKNHLAVADRENGANTDSEKLEISSILLPVISLIKSNVNSRPIKLNSGIVVVNSGSRNCRMGDRTSFGDSLGNVISEDCTNNYQIDTNFSEDPTPITFSDVDPVICENLSKKREGSHEENKMESGKCGDFMPGININDGTESSKGNEDFPREIETPKDETRSRDIDETTMKIQAELSPVYALVNNLKASMTEKEMEDIIMSVRKMMSDINANYGSDERLEDFLYEILRSTEKHCYNVLLENTTRELIIDTRNEKLTDEIVRSFVEINNSWLDECTCGYYFPNENHREPKFLEIGKTLLDKFSQDGNRENCIKLCNSVSFMWRYYLPMSIVDFTIMEDILCSCLRTRDNFVLSMILPMLDVRQWEIAVKCIKDMEMGICPCCDRVNENLRNSKKMVINWSNVARELVKREGTSTAMTFLVLIETVLPDVNLDKSIFQSLIFTKILEHHGVNNFVDFDRNHSESNEYGAMCSPKVQEKLMESMEKDLERPLKKNIFGRGAHHWGMRFQGRSSTCPCCTLALNTPVLLGENGISLFPCGHAYHVNCLIQKKISRCNLH